MYVLLHPKNGDGMGLLAEEPHGGRVPMLDGALVLAVGGGGTVPLVGDPDPAPIALEIAMIRAMRTLAIGCGINERRYVTTVGSLRWNNETQTSASLRVVVNGTERYMQGSRTGWGLSAYEVTGDVPRNYWSQFFLEPWGDAPGRDTDILLAAYAKPFDFGMHYRWAPMHAAWALGAACEQVLGGRVEVRP